MSVLLEGMHCLVDRLASAPSSWTREARVGVLGELQAMRGWLDAREAAVLGASHLECDDVKSGAKDIIQLCQQRANVSFAEAKRRASRATWLPQLHEARDLLAAGKLGSAQCDELCSLAERLEPSQLPALAAAEAELASELCELTPVQARKHLARFEAEIQSEDDGKTKLEAQERANSLKFTERRDGTVGIQGQLDPISAAYLRNHIDHKVSEMWRREGSGRQQLDPPIRVMSNERRRAEALVELVRQAQAGEGPSSGAVTEMLVLIDYQTLLGQLGEHGICQLGDGTPIPPDAARQMACEARIIPIVLAGPSVVLDVGRAARGATPGQRAALRATHDSCCIKSCDVPFQYCQIHHITWWRNGGRSDLANLAPVCSKHHHLIHDYGWALTLDHDGVGSLGRGDTSPDPPKPAARARARPRHHGPDATSMSEAHPDRSPLPEVAPIPRRC